MLPDLLMSTTAAGVVHDLSDVDYRNAGALARSDLARILAKSPAHQYALERDDPNRPPPPAPSPQMAAGSLLHLLVLQPHLLEKRYAIGPDVKSRAVREWKAFEAANPHRECITPLQFETARRQADALRATPFGSDPDQDGTVGDMLDGTATYEASAFWRDEETGLWCKCRPDVAVPVGNETSRGWCLFDLKSTTSAKRDEFNRSVDSYAYDLQDGFYSFGWARATGLPVHSFTFLVVEAEYPHITALYDLPPAWRAYGWERCRAALDLYADCRERGEYPAYGVGVQVLQPPKWHPLNARAREPLS